MHDSDDMFEIVGVYETYLSTASKGIIRTRTTMEESRILYAESAAARESAQTPRVGSKLNKGTSASSCHLSTVFNLNHFAPFIPLLKVLARTLFRHLDLLSPSRSRTHVAFGISRPDPVTSFTTESTIVTGFPLVERTRYRSRISTHVVTNSF